MNILLVEDNVERALEIKSALVAAGHTVTWIVGVQTLAEETAGILQDKSTVTFRVRDFQIAFMDGSLVGKFYGWTIIPLLVRCGVLCIGISGGGDFNPDMRRAGALLACKKEDVVANLASLLKQASDLLPHPTA